MASPSGLIQRIQASLPVRAWQRYGKARGGVLAGGMAYVAFFSLFPALAVGFTVFGLVVDDDAGLQDRVITAVNDAIGTTIITPVEGTGGIVAISDLTGSTELTVVGIVGLIGFLFTGLGWLDAMREGIRAMFGRPTLEGNVVKTKARDLVVLVSIGVVLLASAIGGVAVSGATGALLRWVGLDGSVPGRLLLGAVSTLVLLAVDVMVFLVIFRLLSGVHVPRHDLWDAALFGGIGLGVLKLFAGVLLGFADNNKFLATAGVLLGLLVWLNLISRLTLVAAAWGATVAIDRGHLIEVDAGIPYTIEASAGTTASGSGSASGSGRGAVSGSAVAGSASGSGRGAVSGSALAGSASGRGSEPGAGSGSGPRSGRVRVPAGAVVGAGRVTASGSAAGPAGPAAVPVQRPGGPAQPVPFDPVVSPRQADRISVVAGAVLGAAGLFAARVAAGAVRSVIDSTRRPDPD